jgi:hypothetical protein
MIHRDFVFFASEIVLLRFVCEKNYYSVRKLRFELLELLKVLASFYFVKP